MLQYLLDTDHLTLYEHGHPPLRHRLSAALAAAPDCVGLTAVTAEEALRGRLAYLARARTGNERVHRFGLFLATLQITQHFPLAPFDQAAELQFQTLRALKIKIGHQDLKMAAVALACHCVLVTRNQQDFGQVPGLGLEDWSV